MFDRLPLAFSQIPSHRANLFLLTFVWIAQFYTTSTLPPELQLSAFACISVVLAVPTFVRVVRSSQYLYAEGAIATYRRRSAQSETESVRYPDNRLPRCGRLLSDLTTISSFM